MSDPPLRVPSALLWWRTVRGGAEWLGRLPALVSECAEQWSLELDAPCEAHVSAELREPGAAQRISRRLGLVARELQVDRERMRRWGIGMHSRGV
jgi:hypothetical protein